jgi:hypothetical protein
MTAGQKINRPHWKELCREKDERIAELEAQVASLQTTGVDPGLIARVKAEAFAAGVASMASFTAKQ